MATEAITFAFPQARPTELLVLLADTTPPLRQLLRLTFLDLLRQQVLLLEERASQPNPRDPVTVVRYVQPGPALATYQPRPYEALLLRPFLTQGFGQLQLRHFVKMAYGQALTGSWYAGIIRRAEPLQPLYQAVWWRRWLDLPLPTPAGERLREQVRQELDQHDSRLNQLTHHDAAAALQLASSLGGLLFLLPTFRSPVGHALDQELYRVQREQPVMTADGGSTYDSWDNCGHHFDSCADAAGGDHGGSGCGGDAGCGGDSGCGGCGGD